MENYHILKVFIGSPDDVQKERQSLRRIAADVNRVIRTMGWQIEVIGWEDVLPGAGRPQERINRDLEACDLFIGLLHKRWGSPTGEYSSGFEEEFHLALELNKNKNEPDIWLYFKAIEDGQRNEEDEQQQKVVEFRERVKSERLVQFTDLKDEGEWEEKIRNSLLTYVIQLHQEDTAASENDQPPSSTPKEQVETEEVKPKGKKKSKKSDKSQQELQALLKKTMSGESPEESINNVDAARLHLFSTASIPENFSGKLGNHVANLLYVHRQSIHPTGREKRVIFNTIIDDAVGYLPGWYWFDDKKEDTVARLIRTAAFSSEESIRRSATTMLAKLSAPLEIEGLEHEELSILFLLDSSDELVPKKFDYFAQVASFDDIPLLDRMISDGKEAVSKAATFARARVIARQDPNRILSDVVKGSLEFSDGLEDELEKQQDQLDEALLIAGLEHSEKDVRVFAGEQLDALKKISEEMAHKMLKDESYALQTIAQRNLLQRGEISLSDVKNDYSNELHPLGIEILSKKPIEELRSKIDWFSIDGTNAYEALAKHHFNDFAEQVRIDLGDDFESLRSKAFQELEQKYPKEAGEIIKKFGKGGDLDNFIHTSLITIALEALAEHGQASDAVLARRYMSTDRTEARLAAIKILEEFGDVSDCAELVKLTSPKSSVSQSAARAALKLSGRSVGMLNTLLDSDIPVVVDVALSSLKPEDLDQFMKRIKALLSHKSDNVRERAVACLSRLAGDKMLREILEEYYSNESYYYNVVCLLDRLLYAPQSLRGKYIETLQEPFDNWYQE